MRRVWEYGSLPHSLGTRLGTWLLHTFQSIVSKKAKRPTLLNLVALCAQKQGVANSSLNVLDTQLHNIIVLGMCGSYPCFSSLVACGTAIQECDVDNVASYYFVDLEVGGGHMHKIIPHKASNLILCFLNP